MNFISTILSLIKVLFTLLHNYYVCFMIMIIKDMINCFHNIPLALLPPIIKAGVPIAMFSDFSKTYWGQDFSEYGDLSHEAKTLLGLQNVKVRQNKKS